METLTLELTGMAHGGMALGRDRANRVIFVPGGIPGERVAVELVDARTRFATGRLREILQPSPYRVDQTAPEAGPHGGHTYQHIAYEHQLELKRAVVVDQLKRIGGLETEVRPVIPAPAQWAYDHDVVLSPTPEGGFGFWSSIDQQVVPAGRSPTLISPLQDLISDFDLELPDLRKLTLRAGTDGGLLVALEVEGVEPPELLVDFPVSVSIVLPDETAASLIGFNHVTREVEGHPFVITAGCRFHGHVAALPGLVRTVTRYADLNPRSVVLEPFAGVGLLTRFLAAGAAEVIAIEVNPDAVADAAENLADTDNVSVFEDWMEEVVPGLERPIDVIVMDTPAGGVSREGLQMLAAHGPRRIVYSGRDIATTARDGKELAGAGYRLVELQPLDLLPQTFHVHTVGLWEK